MVVIENRWSLYGTNLIIMWSL